MLYIFQLRCIFNESSGEKTVLKLFVMSILRLYFSMNSYVTLRSSSYFEKKKTFTQTMREGPPFSHAQTLFYYNGCLSTRNNYLSRQLQKVRKKYRCSIYRICRTRVFELQMPSKMCSLYSEQYGIKVYNRPKYHEYFYRGT